MQKCINAVSKNKITHFVQANNKRTLCSECCDKRAENANT